MAPSHSRKRRAAETQRLVARYLARHGWPHATDQGAGRSGEDILGVPGLSIEVKARRDLNLPAWLRQAANQGTGLPIVVHRPDGFGPERLADWPATLRLEDLTSLLRDAGYGDPRAAEHDDDDETRCGHEFHDAELDETALCIHCGTPYPEASQ